MNEHLLFDKITALIKRQGQAEELGRQAVLLLKSAEYYEDNTEKDKLINEAVNKLYQLQELLK